MTTKHKNTKPLRLFAPNGVEIEGTAETMLTLQAIRVYGRKADGSLEWEYSGLDHKDFYETEEQRKDANGEPLFTDHDGRDWPQSALSLEGEPLKAMPTQPPAAIDRIGNFKLQTPSEYFAEQKAKAAGQAAHTLSELTHVGQDDLGYYLASGEDTICRISRLDPQHDGGRAIFLERDVANAMFTALRAHAGLVEALQLIRDEAEAAGYSRILSRAHAALAAAKEGKPA